MSLNSNEKVVIETVKPIRVLMPMIIGLAVILFLLRRQFDWDQWNQINWSYRMLFWIMIALIMLMLRHLAYSYRLYVLSDKSFSYLKSIELIFIWEFSSAVSPTSLGGSAVALVVLAQEKLTTAKVATMVIYTVVLDTAFFIISLPYLYMIVGPTMIQPGIHSLSELSGFGSTFIVAYFLMAAYGLFFFYGLFFNPGQFKSILRGIGSIKYLIRWKEKIYQLSDEIMLASSEIKNSNALFHLQAILATVVAWACRFLVLSCIILGFESALSLDFATQTSLYARLEAMFVIIAFSPTPGGSGFVEVVASNFLKDYAVNSILIVAFVWRILAYYSYLIAGMIIVPNWIRKVIRKKLTKHIPANPVESDQNPAIDEN